MVVVNSGFAFFILASQTPANIFADIPTFLLRLTAQYRENGNSTGNTDGNPSSNFDYKAAYTKYGVQDLTKNGSVFTIAVKNNVLSEKVKVFNSTTDYIKSDLFALVGGATEKNSGKGPLTVCLQFDAPNGATHAKVNGRETQDLQTENAVSGISGWKGDLLCYNTLTQVDGKQTDGTVKFNPVQDATKTLKITWLKDNKVVAFNTVTVNIDAQ